MNPAQDVVEAGLTAGAARGADGCLVLVDEASHADVRFAVNTTTTNGVRRDRTVSVVVMVGTAVGLARRSGVVDVDEMVAAALLDAQSAPAAEDAFALVDGGSSGGMDFGSAPIETDLGALSGVLSGLGGAFERARQRDVVLAGFAEFGISTLYLGSSTGLRVAHSQPTGAINLVGRSLDGARSVWTGMGSEDLASVSFASLEDELWRRLEWSAKSVALEAGRYEVILPPSGVADLMGSLFFYGMGGQEAEDGRTVFSAADGGARVGDQLSSVPFTMYSDPFEPGLECLPFVAAASSDSETSVFDNGLPVARTDWIRDGRLTQLRYHRAGAARSGVAAAPFIDNLVLRAPEVGAGSVDDMVARTERGLLLTCLWYIREVDPSTLLLTGLTRDGVYVVEDGKVVGAANNFRFNESPVDLLSRATEVGTPERALGRELGEYLNRAIMPAMRIPDFNMSSVSQAS
jgi:predicted Zn-dependent protease